MHFVLLKGQKLLFDRVFILEKSSCLLFAFRVLGIPKEPNVPRKFVSYVFLKLNGVLTDFLIEFASVGLQFVRLQLLLLHLVDSSLSISAIQSVQIKNESQHLVQALWLIGAEILISDEKNRVFLLNDARPVKNIEVLGNVVHAVADPPIPISWVVILETKFQLGRVTECIHEKSVGNNEIVRVTYDAQNFLWLKFQEVFWCQWMVRFDYPDSIISDILSFTALDLKCSPS